MKKAAVFGVIKDGKNDISINYFNHLSQSGINGYCIYPQNPQSAAKEYDCLVICGGGDIHPKYYGEKPYLSEQIYNNVIDEYEIKIITAFINEQKPILGICRGMQSINVALGGTLIQDIPGILKLCHQSIDERECYHEIKISKNSKLSNALGLRSIVNSDHHQCIDLLGSHLIKIASAHDGVTEAIESTRLPILGIQWHPERMNGNDVFEYFKNTYLN